MVNVPCVYRRNVVAVFGYAEKSLKKIRDEDTKRYKRLVEQAKELGAWLAQQDVHLLTGGGEGTMEAVSQGFYESGNKKGGLVIGIIPGPTLKGGYPNKWVEVPIYTHLPGDDPMAETSRNHINVLSANVLVALPGGDGTLAELKLAGKIYKKPIAVFLGSTKETVGNLNQKDLIKKEYKVITTQKDVQEFVLSELAKLAPNPAPAPGC